ncbi:hypothetical protein QUB63_14840 [Microcoleus sp. ARI1-B5]|uniref:hypothetical protein n=1 Tax=unclassified Microcoleus TaxID=2642155 RepID=UPI002FD799C1
MTENTTKTRYQNKYLTIWMVTGAVLWGLGTICLLISGELSNLSLNEIIMFLLVAPIGGSIIFPSWAGFGMLFEASTRYNWKFGAIEHQTLVWYIYPIFTIFDIVLSMTVGFFIYMVRSALFR